MAGILRVDQIQSTGGSNVIDVSSGTFKIWNGSSYESFSVTGALISINTYTSQNGTWNSKTTSGGSGTWTKPSRGTFVIIFAIGAGGGGCKSYLSNGGAGGGGGAGDGAADRRAERPGLDGRTAFLDAAQPARCQGAVRRARAGVPVSKIARSAAASTGESTFVRPASRFLM